MPRGKLITIEGLDGAGKTTLAEALAREIEARGFDVELLREPGGVAIAEQIRDLLKDPAHSNGLGGRAEALLYAAARAQLTDEKLVPLLASGRWVLLDRFVDSSLAYQGAGRSLGVGRVGEVNRFATGDLTPDRTLYLRVEPETGRARQSGRAEAADRMEREDGEFFTRVADAYDDLARSEPARIREIDAEQDADAVLRDALEAIADLTAAAR